MEELKANPMLDLELLLRRMETLPPTRAAAEVWMLLNRNSEEELLYEWAAWYFDHQKLYGETARVIKAAERKGIKSPWMELHKSLALLENGKTNESEKLLKEALAFQGNKLSKNWRIAANLGRIQESRRAISIALDHYENAAQAAAEEVPVNNKDRSLLQMRISRCLEALGRQRDAERAMAFAAELDASSPVIRRELRRLEGW